MPLFEKVMGELKARETPPLLAQELYAEEVSRRLMSVPGENVREELRRAALLLWNDDLQAAHFIVQNDESADAAFIHAIIHRREGDFSNARYWWRRAASSSLFQKVGAALSPMPEVAEYALLDAKGNFDEMRFTELCENATPENEETLRRIQAAEMAALPPIFFAP